MISECHRDYRDVIKYVETPDLNSTLHHKYCNRLSQIRKEVNKYVYEILLYIQNMLAVDYDSLCVYLTITCHS